MVISVKIQNFSRSRMTKRTSPLESYHIEFRRIQRQSEFHVFRGNEGNAGHMTPCEWFKRRHVLICEQVKHELM